MRPACFSQARRRSQPRPASAFSAASAWRWRRRAPENWYTDELDPWLWKQHGVEAVLAWLLERKIARSFRATMRPPMTADKVMMQERTESPHYTFMRELRDKPETYVNGVDWLSVDDMRQLFTRRFGEAAPDVRQFRQAYMDVFGEVIEFRAVLGVGYVPRETYLLCVRDGEKWKKRKETYGSVARHYRKHWADHAVEQRLGLVESIDGGMQPVRRVEEGTGAAS